MLGRAPGNAAGGRHGVVAATGAGDRGERGGEAERERERGRQRGGESEHERGGGRTREGARENAGGGGSITKAVVWVRTEERE